jgi:hypothetical protein
MLLWLLPSTLRHYGLQLELLPYLRGMVRSCALPASSEVTCDRTPCAIGMMMTLLSCTLWTMRQPINL